jgi:hypothetical protein
MAVVGISGNLACIPFYCHEQRSELISTLFK